MTLLAKRRRMHMLCSKKMVRFATFLHYINNLEVKRLAIAATPYRIKKEIEGG